MSFGTAGVVMLLEPFSASTVAAVLSLLTGGYLAYAGAVDVALALGMAVRTGFDLGRKPFFEAIAIQIPKTLSEEREVWKQIMDFMLFNKPGWRADPLPETPVADARMRRFYANLLWFLLGALVSDRVSRRLRDEGSRPTANHSNLRH